MIIIAFIIIVLVIYDYGHFFDYSKSTESNLII
jgi:hypothetical protein